MELLQGNRLLLDHRYARGGKHVFETGSGVLHSCCFISAMGGAVSAFWVVLMAVFFPMGSLHQILERLGVPIV